MQWALNYEGGNQRPGGSSQREQSDSPTGQSDSKGLKREPRGHKKVTQGPKKTLFPELDANSGLLPTVSLSNVRGKTGSFRSMA